MPEHRTIRLAVPEAAAGVLTALRLVLPLARKLRLVIGPRVSDLTVAAALPRSGVQQIHDVAAQRDRVESLRLQASRVLRVRRVVVHSPVEHVASIQLVALRVAGIRYQSPPATPFGYPDRPLRNSRVDELRDRMPAAALIWDDVVRHFGRPARVRFAEAGHVVEWRQA